MATNRKKNSRGARAGGSNRRGDRSNANEAAEGVRTRAATATGRAAPAAGPGPRSDIDEHTASGESRDRPIARRDSDRDQLGQLPPVERLLNRQWAESLRGMLAQGDGQV